MQQRRDLAGFTGSGYSIGRHKVIQALWLIIQDGIVKHWWCPAKLRVWILRRFGAHIGNNVLIRHRVRIHWPWKLRIGDNSWVGEGVWLLNLENIVIGSNVCISQDAFICTGSHDRRSSTFEFDNAPIFIEDEAWIAAKVNVLRGVRVGKAAVVGAGCTVTRDVPSSATMVPAPISEVKRG